MHKHNLSASDDKEDTAPQPDVDASWLWSEAVWHFSGNIGRWWLAEEVCGDKLLPQGARRVLLDKRKDGPQSDQDGHLCSPEGWAIVTSAMPVNQIRYFTIIMLITFTHVSESKVT